MKKLSYKGYGASVDYINGDLVIKVLGVREALVARCIRPADVEPALRRLVDGYLHRCQFEGCAPETPRLVAA